MSTTDETRVVTAAGLVQRIVLFAIASGVALVMGLTSFVITSAQEHATTSPEPSTTEGANP